MSTRPTLTETEILFMHYKNGMAGSGMTALIDAIWKLDRKNRAKIAMGYPELVELCNRYNDELGYWQELQTKWKEANQYINADL